MVELEQLNEHRFYKLQSVFPQKCTSQIGNIYHSVDSSKPPFKTCGGLLRLHMVDGSINMKCNRPDCMAQYDIPRVCNSCGRATTFEDVTCDGCEPIVINITTWKVSISECNKAIKKINRAFKQNLIDESEWKSALKIQQDELTKCEKELEKLDL